MNVEKIKYNGQPGLYMGRKSKGEKREKKKRKFGENITFYSTKS